MSVSGIIFTEQVSGSFTNFIKEQQVSNAVLLTDSNTERLCLSLLKENTFDHIAIPAGEIYKNMDTLQHVLEGMMQRGADRNTWLFNLGGGVVSDLGGFAASIYKRGIRYVNIPTTLLAMVDASIGGKTAVDFKFHKNYLGTFCEPEAVIISPEFLATLPESEIRSAWAEIIKTAVICNGDMISLIRRDVSLARIIESAAMAKSRIVAQDKYDRGVRQLLNFGHTIGHAFESYRLSIDKPVSHGEAVAKGMLYETRLAEQMGFLSTGDAHTIRDMIGSKLDTGPLTTDEFSALLPFLPGDKKNTDERITFSLPVAVGEGKYGVKVHLSDLKA